MLEVRGVFKSYATPQGPLPVLQGVDLTLKPGSSLALMGESGSGKSTLLHLIAGLDKVDRGSIRSGEHRLEQMNEGQLASWRRTEIGLVFQQFNLIGSLRVEDNLAFQARLAGRHDPRWQAHLVQRLGLASCSALSGATVWRPAAAGCTGAGAGLAAETAAGRRAHRQPR
jgi:putative ABC transport system ATP-binding protein